MKALPKRKGNLICWSVSPVGCTGLNENPSKEEGKCNIEGLNQATLFVTSMKVPTKP